MIRPLPRRGVVLAYHGVGEVDDAVDPHRLVVGPSRLAEHVDLLQRSGYRFLTAEGLLEETGGAAPPGRTAVLTFDDGWRDALHTVSPLLERLGVRATFYLCPGWLGGRHPLVDGPAGELLSEEDARRLHEAGMELGSHTMTHPDLRRVESSRLDAELRDSKVALERVTGAPCRTLAYPYGLFDERVAAAAGAAGYELAFEWIPGPWRPLAAPRLAAPPRHGARRLALKLVGIRRRRR